MQKIYDAIIIGGGPAGIISAVTIRKYNSKKKILLIRNIKKSVIPCGIPYMFTTLKNPEDNSIGDKSLINNKIDLLIDEVTDVNKKEKFIETKKSKKIYYNKLIFAVGSSPIKPEIKGIYKKNIFFIKKELNYLKNLKNQLKKSRNIVIVGGGFIGVEFADELSKLRGVNISIIEMLPNLLANSFDSEFSKEAEKELIKKNIKLYKNTHLKKILGNGSVDSVLLSNKKKLLADLVLFGIGTNPNLLLAKKAGIKITKSGIVVDKFLKTSDKNIFAVGDCSEKKDFFTKKSVKVMLASTATTQARLAGYNLFSSFSRKDTGTVSSYSTKIGKLVLASSGITEKTARENKIEVISGFTESVDRHPAKLPFASKLTIKLIFSKKSKEIIGGQIMGGDSVGEMINVISVAIQKKLKMHEMELLQIATHPKLTSAPTTYPIINAAQNAIQRLK